jgi:hypothetical protein
MSQGRSGLQWWWPAVSGLAGLVGVAACGTAYLHSQLTPHVSLSDHARIAVLPVTVALVRQGAESSLGNEIDPGAVDVITRALYDMISQHTTFEIIDRNTVDQALTASAGPPATPLAVQALAGSLGAEVILTGIVTRYREREGSHLSVSRPAAVGIELWLHSGQDGRLLWHGSYYEVQKSISEEVRTLPLYWKRGTRWLTAQELAQYAVTELVNAMPHGQSNVEGAKKDQ